MKKILLLMALCVLSCTKEIQPPISTPVTSERFVRVEIHIAILNQKGDNKFGQRSFTLRLQDGYSNADSAIVVNQLIHDNKVANSDEVNLSLSTIAYDLNTDSYPYDTAWIGVHGNLIIEIPVDIWYLVNPSPDNVQRWCDNGYFPYILKEFNTVFDLEKLIYPNTTP